jgi:hypothetical protein
MPKQKTEEAIAAAEAPVEPSIQVTPTLLQQMIDQAVNAKLSAQQSGQPLTNEGLAAALGPMMETVGQSLSDRAGLKSNDSNPEISVFSYPEGERARPKPRLVDRNGKNRKTYFCGTQQDFQQLTPAEILAFNAIQTDCEARGGMWTAKVKMNGSTEELHVEVPIGDSDALRSLPPLVNILYEVGSGKKALDFNQLVAKMTASGKDPHAIIAGLEALLEKAVSAA